LKHFNSPITLVGYNNHEYDDWVICHNLIREGFSVKDGGVVNFFDVSKTVRPYLKSKFGGRKWNLTYAVRTCLGRSQSDGHSAVSDAKDTLDLMVNVVEKKDSIKTCKQVEEVETTCYELAQELPTIHKSSKHVPIFVESSSDVSLINKSRTITSLDMLESKKVFKIGHVYNPAVPSVSKVLKTTMSEESKEILDKWEEKQIAVLGEEGFQKYKADIFSRGHTLHKILETYMETKELPQVWDIMDHVSKRHLSSISQAVKLFDRPLLLESAVTHPSLDYCGVVDCVAMVGDTITLVDWKTSQKVKPNAADLYDNPLQVAAYMGAVNMDERYKELGNISKGAVVVVYNSGYPAMVHMFTTKEMEVYWEQWCQRLHMYQNMEI